MTGRPPLEPRAGSVPRILASLALPTVVAAQAEVMRTATM